ncbi:MAG: sensor histidine kinase [Firmicutes bacterium]|nr:sensor histidine kinase [Bacillota bacterium]
MKRLKFKSLTMRIWTTFTAIILAIILGISVIYMVAYRKIDEQSKLQDLKVAHNIMMNNRTYELSTRFDELRNLKGVDYFVAQLDSSGGLTIISRQKEDQGAIDKEGKLLPPLMTNVGGMDVKTWMSSFIEGADLDGAQYKEAFNNMEFIFIVSSIEGYDGSAADSGVKSYLVTYVPINRDNTMLVWILMIGLVFIGIGFLTAKVVANRISKPLSELEDYTVRIAHKDWKEPIAVKSEDEIGRLASSMNFMQEELKRADSEEKMFLQSISHDLKTPVMVIMSHAEAIIDGVYAESMEKNAEIIRDEAVRLEKKINHLLYLNTLSYVLENDVNPVKVNLRSLLDHIVSRFEAVNGSIEWESELQDLSTFGNMDKIQVSIENIVDNGMRYAESRMKVSLKKKGGFAVIEIYNDGPGIREEHIGKIFDNFYKDKTGNFGLGLAISKKIVDFYKGGISAVNRDKGVSFIIKYPIHE